MQYRNVSVTKSGNFLIFATEHQTRYYSIPTGQAKTPMAYAKRLIDRCYEGRAAHYDPRAYKRS